MARPAGQPTRLPVRVSPAMCGLCGSKALLTLTPASRCSHCTLPERCTDCTTTGPTGTANESSHLLWLRRRIRRLDGCCLASGGRRGVGLAVLLLVSHLGATLGDCCVLWCCGCRTLWRLITARLLLLLRLLVDFFSLGGGGGGALCCRLVVPVLCCRVVSFAFQNGCPTRCERLGGRSGLHLGARDRRSSAVGRVTGPSLSIVCRYI